jgi:hypothetical protein
MSVRFYTENDSYDLMKGFPERFLVCHTLP